MAPRYRGAGRHAGAYQDHADRDLTADPGATGRARAGHVAGDLSGRAPRAAAPARDRVAVHRHDGLRRPQKQTGRGSLRGRFVVSSSGRRRTKPAYFVMSTSLVSGRKKKPTTAV